MESLPLESYSQFLGELKSRIQAAQLRASLAVNRELVMLYWQIGRDILDRQNRESWGAKVIDRLAMDLKRSFPNMKGFSPRYLKYMRAFVVVDLKMKAFEPEFADKMNFYLSALNDLLRHPDDQPSIGIILLQDARSLHR